MEAIKVQKSKRILKKALHVPKRTEKKLADNCTLASHSVALEDTQDSSSSKKAAPLSRLEPSKSPKLSLPPSNKENMRRKEEYEEDLLETPFVPSKTSNLVSTAASSLDADLSSQVENSSPREEIPRKSSKKGKVAHVAYVPNRKAIKKNKAGKKLYKSYLALVDRKTKRSEYFRLYKDAEVGFERDLQETIKETVSSS
eukprot:TRINITY_DN12725_c0_g1_i10.p1 TRINITY_DN12725_c0_g1~~TRINITY_DN12725_c0_g1_i10.p1  ORF type:complete len:199 (+),score=65.18 TRINITY_DN12725_c0_g1_i10:100-696(+)